MLDIAYPQLNLRITARLKTFSCRIVSALSSAPTRPKPTCAPPFAKRRQEYMQEIMLQNVLALMKIAVHVVDILVCYSQHKRIISWSSILLGCSATTAYICSVQGKSLSQECYQSVPHSVLAILTSDFFLDSFSFLNASYPSFMFWNSGNRALQALYSQR